MSSASTLLSSLFRAKRVGSSCRHRSRRDRIDLESLEQRLALSGEGITVTGTKWLDINGNGIRDNDLIQGDAPDVVFVVDVSLSTLTPFAGTPVGDVNSDGSSNDILDASLAGFIALNEQLGSVPGVSGRSRVGIVAFAETGEILDMDPQTPGLQIFARPNDDKDNNGTKDVMQVLRGIRRGLGTTINAGNTNYEAALQKATTVFDQLGTSSGQGNLVFLSDGQPNRPLQSPSDYADEAQALRARGYNTRAFGAFGNNVALPPLQVIDPVVAGSRPGAKIFTSTDELVGVFAGLRGDSLRYKEPGLAGVRIYIDVNDNGTWDGDDEPSAISRADDPATPVDELGTYTISTGIVPPGGTYRVREVVPNGYVHTSLGTLSIPNPSNPLQPIRNQADGSWILTIPAGQSRSNIDFGNAPGSISGYKWRDDVPNGIRDSSLVVGTNPDVVFVIDVSGSTENPFGGTPVGDVNSDGKADTILDAELQGFIKLNEQLVSQGFGTSARVSIVVFGSQAASVDMNPTAGDQSMLVTNPTADVDGNGVLDIEQILRRVTSGGTKDGISVGGTTSYKAALTRADEVFAAIGTASGQGNMIFLSDGEPNTGDAYAAEVTKIKARGVNQRAFGAGDGAKLPPLQIIDPKAAIFRTSDELLVAFGTPQGASSSGAGFSEPGLAGVRIYVDLNNNRAFDPGEPSALTRSDDPATKNVDETGMYEITGLSPGTYTVREVVPQGTIQTSEGSEPSYGNGSVRDGSWSVTIGGESPSRATNIDFGNCPDGGVISGVKWRDDNRNGIRDGSLVVGDDPDLVFVIDVSGSVADPFVGGVVGDVNNDGKANTILDAELQGFIDLNKRLIARGYGATSRVSIIVFGNSAATVSFVGGATIIAPNTDGDKNSVPDVEQLLRSVIVGGIRNGLSVGQGTHYDSALGEALTAVTALNSPRGEANVIFLSDGAPATGADGVAQATALRSRGVNLRAFGAGTGSSLPALQALDPQAVIFRTSDELIAAFGGLQGPGSASFLEPGLAGVEIYIDLDNDGQWDANEPKTVTAADDPSTPNVDEAGSYSFKGLAAGTYRIREIVPANYVLTSLGTLEKFTYEQLTTSNRSQGPLTYNGQPTNNKNNNNDGSWTVKLGWDPSDSWQQWDGEYYDPGSYIPPNYSPGGYKDTWISHIGVQYEVIAKGIDFGNAPPSEIRGTKWLDLDEDGTRDLCNDNKSIVFAIDVSGSTWNRFLGMYGGDINGDGKPNTILDGQLEAVLHVHDQIVTANNDMYKLLGLDVAGSATSVSLVVYGSTATAIDLDPVAAGVQNTVTASADRNRNGIADFVEAVQAVREGHAGVGVGTNHEAALASAASVAGFGSRLVFFSDGPATAGGSITEEIAALDTKGVTRLALGVGGLAAVNGQWGTALNQIDSYNNPQFLATCDALRYVIEDFGCVNEPGIPGVTVYVDLNDNNKLDEAERIYSAVTREDDPATLADETGTYVITGAPAGTYRVREVLPNGYKQTYPSGGSHQVTIAASGTTSGISRSNDFGNAIDPFAPMVNLPGPSIDICTAAFPAMPLDPNATVLDTDSETFSGGSMRVSVTSGAATAVSIVIADQSAGIDRIGVNGSSVTFNGIAIGTFAGGTSGTPLTVSFNANATPRAAQALLRSITVRRTASGANVDCIVTVRVTDDTGKIGIERSKRLASVTIGGVEFGSTSQGYAFANNGILRQVTSGGRPVTSAQLPTGWQMRGVWASGTGYRAFLFDGKGAYSVWTLDANGAFVSSQRQPAAQIAQIETQVNFDLDQDGFTRSNVVIGGVEFGSTAQGYAFLHNGKLRQVTSGGRPVTTAQLPTGWQMRGVWVSGTGYQAYLFDGKGAFSIWTLDSNAAFVSSQRQAVTQINLLESQVGFDLNQDGTRTTFTRANVVIGGVEFGSTQQGYAFVHNGHLRQVTSGGRPVTVAQLPIGWQMRGVWASGSAYQAFLFDGKGAFSVWTLDATGAFVSSQRQAVTQINLLETQVGFDLNQDGIRTTFTKANLVIGGVEFGSTQQGYAFIHNGHLRQVTSGGRPVTTAQLPTGWQMRGAWVSGTGYQAFLFDGKGTFSIWTLDANAAFVSSQRRTAAEIAQIENAIKVDLDQNGKIGQ